MKLSFSHTLQGIKSTAIYFLFWLAYFLVFRAIFLLYHFPESRTLDTDLLAGSFYHGINMDVSFACYITMLVLLFLCLPITVKSAIVNKILVFYTLSFLIVIAILFIADLELFNEWGYRIDTSVLIYLTTPRELAASVSSSPYALLITFIVVTIVITYRVYKTLVHPRFMALSKPTPIQCVVYIILAGALIIPIRGGFQLAPMNQSSVFFSKNDFANQAAINVPWNFFWSLSKQLYSSENPYSYLPMDQGDSVMNIWYKKQAHTVCAYYRNAKRDYDFMGKFFRTGGLCAWRKIK